MASTALAWVLLTVLPGVGHLSPLEAPTEMASLIDGLVDEHCIRAISPR